MSSNAFLKFQKYICTKKIPELKQLISWLSPRTRHLVNSLRSQQFSLVRSTCRPPCPQTMPYFRHHEFRQFYPVVPIRSNMAPPRPTNSLNTSIMPFAGTQMIDDMVT